jgi:hypothetical protein
MSAIALCTAGCAGADAARQLADHGAIFTNQFKQETQTFFKAQGELHQSIAESIAFRQRDAQRLTLANRVQRGAWQAQANNNAVAIYDALTGNTADVLLVTSIDLQTLKPVSTAPLSGVDLKPFDEVTAGLKKLAAEPDLAERSAFFLQEGKAVYDAYKKTIDKGTETVNAAKKSK